MSDATAIDGNQSIDFAGQPNEDRASLRALDLRLKASYSSSEDNLLDDFYIPCLERSQSYWRSAGFFSSGLLALRPLAFAEFIENSGTIRLICCPKLQPQDVAAILASTMDTSATKRLVVQELRLLAGSSEPHRRLATILSSMIHAGVLDLHVLVPIAGVEAALFHDKMGIFRSGRDAISFVGSANESAAAYLPDRHLEMVEVFRSWDMRDRDRVERHEINFERLWRGPRGWRAIKHQDLKEEIFEIAAPTDLNDAFEQVRREKATRGIALGEFVLEPVEPVQKSLRPYQTEVVEDWERNGHRGIVRFATGGGKSLVGIEAIRRWRAKGGSALVLVPTGVLHDQWYEELGAELPGENVVPVGNGYALSGRESLILRSLKEGIVLSTYATAASKDFVEIAVRSSGCLVVGDEVHNAGQPRLTDFLRRLDASARIGLSATPERYGDQEGTQRVINYFGPYLSPEYSLVDAIHDGVLTPYLYDYCKVALSDLEQIEYNRLTERIARLLGGQSLEGQEVTGDLKMLLLRRANVIKNAGAKARESARVIGEHWKPGDRWLVYCANQSQLRHARAAIQRLNLGKVIEYHQNMIGDRDLTLSYFEDVGGILLAIKCLDEGVNIPVINKAIILASSTNPREYIQRRGRLLRRSPGKEIAGIWDCMVTNTSGVVISVGELRRGINFAKDSENPVAMLRMRKEVRDAGLGEIDTEDED